MNATPDELVVLLCHGVKDPTPVTIHAETEPALTAAGVRRFGANVVKRSRFAGVLGFNYKREVNAQRRREGKRRTFRPQSRAWGCKVKGTPLVTYDGETYVEVMVTESIAREYRDGAGRRLPVNQVERYLADRSEAPSQGLKRPVIVRDYAVESIRRVVVGGVTINVTD